MPKVIKIKKKPEAPTRQKKKIKHEFSEGASLKDIIDNVPDHATFYTSQGYYDYREYFFKWEEEESDTQWAHRLNGYNRRLEEYNKWYTDNIDDIQHTIEKQKENKGAKARLQAEKKKEQLEKELDKLNRILK